MDYRFYTQQGPVSLSCEHGHTKNRAGAAESRYGVNQWQYSFYLMGEWIGSFKAQEGIQCFLQYQEVVMRVMRN